MKRGLELLRIYSCEERRRFNEGRKGIKGLRVNVKRGERNTEKSKYGKTGRNQRKGRKRRTGGREELNWSMRVGGIKRKVS